MYFLQVSERKSIFYKDLARFLEEIFFCQVLAKNVFSARILQDLYFLSRSCKNLARIVSILNQGSEIFVEFEYVKKYGEKEISEIKRL